MSVETKARIAEELALLTQLVQFPASPFQYGSDISCDTDLDGSLGEVDQGSMLGLSQALVRRLDCPRGENPDDPNYGIGLRQMLNVGTVDSDINKLAGQIRIELLKDDRVESLRVQVVPTNNGKNLAVSLQVVAVDPNTQTFTLTLNASSASILIEEIRAER